jgi:polyphosphate kinase
MKSPCDGEISAYFKSNAPEDVRQAIKGATKGVMLKPAFPHRNRLKKKPYQTHYDALQIELAKFQSWVKESNQRVAIIFEGRDAAGKGGAIKRLRENLNPRVAKVVALSKPTEEEQGQWYFQRYINHLPTAGTMTLFDRSWYNRGVVEKVFDFCSDAQGHKFFDQVGPFENMLEQEGVHLIKFWLNVGRAEQLARFMERERNPLKYWKLSWIDVEGLNRWNAYSDAIDETLSKTNFDHSPWHVVRAYDKRCARLAVTQTILSQFDYTGRNDTSIGMIDELICGTVDL